MRFERPRIPENPLFIVKDCLKAVIHYIHTKLIAVDVGWTKESFVYILNIVVRTCKRSIE